MALCKLAKRDHRRVSDPLAGMIWHIAGPPDFLSIRAEQPARVSVLTPDPGSCLLRGPVQNYRDGFGRCCRRVDKEPLAIGGDVPTENL